MANSNYDVFFSALEKNANIISKAMRIPIGVALGGAAALYFGPRLIHGFLDAKRTHDTATSNESLKNIELANQAMVQELRSMAPAPRPRKDSYPYV